MMHSPINIRYIAYVFKVGLFLIDYSYTQIVTHLTILLQLCNVPKVA